MLNAKQNVTLHVETMQEIAMKILKKYLHDITITCPSNIQIFS